MSARIILEYPKIAGAFANFKVLLGAEEIDTIERGETKTFDCKEDTLSLKYGLKKTNTLEIKDNFVHYVTVRYNALWSKWSLEITKLNPLTENGEVVEKKTVVDNSVSVKPVYSVVGVRGKSLDVYPEKCVITTKVSVGSFIMGNATDGEKTIFYADCNGVQYKAAGMLIGYLQLETASGMMNNRGDNYASENSFNFEADLNLKMKEIYEYINSRISEIKSGKNNAVTVVQQVSAADELKKFKELLDMDVISQEEFDEKKKQLLGL